MRVLVVGPGAVGARAARQLNEADDVDEVLLAGGPPARRRDVAKRSGDGVAAVADPTASAEVVVLAGPAGAHIDLARHHLGEGRSIVSVSDSLGDALALLDLDAEASARGATVIAGAAFSPGLTCLLARHAARDLDLVDEIHVARSGTGGPGCARQHHHALGGTALDWRDYGWQRRPGGSGRELCWFPDPIGALDCYRAELPDPVLARADLPRRGPCHRAAGSDSPRSPHRAPAHVAHSASGGPRRSGTS